ncbi:MAG: efflux RND transporter permease subunit, partial [Limisphaerales bacterium]
MQSHHHKPHALQFGIAGKIARSFIDSKLTPLIIITSVLLGLFATYMLPREEEPQIKVPMIDILVSMPGASAKEVEERATRPMEKLLWEIPDVEYIYSTSQSEQALVIVRFKVGQDLEKSIVRINQKLQANYDKIPVGVSFPLIKPRTIDDVPILVLTFHSKNYDHLTLRRIAAQVDDAVKQIPLVAETTIIGGYRKQVRVLLDPARLASRNLSPAGIVPMIQQANRQHIAGGLTSNNKEVVVETGAFLTSAKEVGQVVVGVYAGKPVYLRDVAEIVEGAEEPSQYVFFGYGSARAESAEEQPAVSLSIAKRPGANAIDVANRVLEKVDNLKGYMIPPGVEVSITRHYGETASEKSNELLFHMAIAIVSVSLLILFTLGWRESIIVAIAIPSTLALTLLMFYLYGYTLNRITLFALIFSIGILVDDAIVVVENIVRHFHHHKKIGSKKSITEIAVEAVNEVGNPTILATFAVIFAVLPMAFVGGLMGPYMRPIPTGSSAAMFFSLGIAFIVTPWAAIRILKHDNLQTEEVEDENGKESKELKVDISHEEDFLTRLYRRFMQPLISHRLLRYGFLSGIIILLIGAMALVGIGWVKVKMLPFDNKSEFQIILNMPEGSALEETARVAREIAAAVRVEPEVTDYQIYAGVSAPFNFNGLVRHYYMRRGANIADIQVNLVNKHQRKAQSHDIAKRVRPRVAAIAAKYGARIAVAEVPHG